MTRININGTTIPYQLRPRKAIERNIFVDLLKKIDASNNINIRDYRYIGFGAAYLEDFKQMHLELGIVKMHSIEMDEYAYSRQLFNNPYYFVVPHLATSTEYIDKDFKSDLNQIIWLDYAMPKMLRQQLTDIEILSSKLIPFDIVKFTFNARLSSFISSHNIKNKGSRCNEFDFKTILNFLNEDPTFSKYLPEEVKVLDIKDFDSVIRAMAVRAVNRGLSDGARNIKFHHLTAFSYADGQDMTTLTGIICSDKDFLNLLDHCKLRMWPFYNKGNDNSEFIEAIEIAVPDMTVSERIEIDKKIPTEDITTVARELSFNYGINMDEHIHLIKGYHDFYKYLPYFSKVIY